MWILKSQTSLKIHKIVLMGRFNQINIIHGNVMILTANKITTTKNCVVIANQD
jgi:hypothetical protein